MTNEELAVVPIPHAEPAAVVLWGTNEPNAMVVRMSAVATALEGAIRERRMFKKIGDRDYVFVDGWTMCGAMLGIFPRTASLDEMRDADGEMFGFRANVELVSRDGGTVGGAVAICTRNEERWADRDWNQIASMAQTRATGKAYRATLGFVIQMAGYASTPAEEMDGIIDPPQRAERPQDRAQQPVWREAAGIPAEKHNGVPAPPQHLDHVGHLSQYAKYHHNLSGFEVAGLFGLNGAGQIGVYVGDRFMGDFDLAAEALESAILEQEASQ